MFFLFFFYNPWSMPESQSHPMKLNKPEEMLIPETLLVTTHALSYTMKRTFQTSGEPSYIAEIAKEI